MKYPNIRLGRVEAVWNKLGGEDGVDRFLCGKTAVVEAHGRWLDRDGAIYFSVTSTGMTGQEWVNHIEKKGLEIEEHAKHMLLSSDFQPTSGVTTDILVLKGTLFEDVNRQNQIIRAFAAGRGLGIPNAEVACLISEAFSAREIKAMGLKWIATMHEPIKDSNGEPCVLCVRGSDDSCSLDSHNSFPDFEWDSNDGFAFVALPI